MSASNILLGLLNVVTVVVFFDLPSLSVYNTLVISSEYDYIIGSAGCALANRLSADPSKTVLLLEAGGLEDAAVQVPFFAPLLQRTSLDWAYESVPQQNTSYLYDDNVNRFPRGKALGGSSSINYIIYSRGDRRDYDTWNSTYGASGWSYDEVLPYFVDLETSYLDYDSELRGTSGEVPVSFPTSHSVASDAFLAAGQELGYGQGDYNSGDQYYFSRVQNNIKNGERWSSSKSFITPSIRARPNLDVGLFSRVTKVLFEGTTAVGVQYTRYLLTRTVKSRREVILCAGAIGSAHILLLSGIGPQADLQALGMLDGYYKQKRGQYAFQIVPILLRPKSTGTIKLNSTDPTAYPIIDPKFLSNEDDWNVAVAGARLAVQAFQTQAMKNVNVTLFDIPVPGCESAGALWSDSYLRCLVRQTAHSGWHPCCTAPMGTHSAAVLDVRLR
ncbi:hypothetical protein HPB50_018850 [Hyalomma asiaticum]|uniref:Uncharacterized protein n=1 Tax=Hyalomma asiaticum TaxID=266040 RepID=A0ACB7RRP2_HYAAI|nr:hypothetical protein HPB50_018850 [Hyalomma asiaticum]